MEVGGQHYAPAALLPGKKPGLGGPHGRSGRLREISPPTGIRSPDRPANRCTDYALLILK